MDIMTTISRDTTSFGQDTIQSLCAVRTDLGMAECQTIEHAVALIHTSIKNTVAGPGKITGAAMTVVQATMAPMTAFMAGATGSKAL